MAAYKKLREKSKESNVDIGELRIIFQDSILIIYKVTEDSVFQQIERIVQTLAANYSNLVLQSGEQPFEIHDPVFEDSSEQALCRFRVLLDVDETIPHVSPSCYFGFWGLAYDYSKARIYDVQRRILIDHDFYTLRRYWSEWEARRRGER